jgi:hypothetical protein
MCSLLCKYDVYYRHMYTVLNKKEIIIIILKLETS